MEVIEWRKGEFWVTTDPGRLDIDIIHGFLARQAEWAIGIPRSKLEKSLRNSLCFSLLRGNSQIGLARVISDYATIAYLGDVFILPEYRRHGLAKWLIECILLHPDLLSLRRWILVTEDAHGLYRKFGFTQLSHPEGFMELHNPDVYKSETPETDPSAI